MKNLRNSFVLFIALMAVVSCKDEKSKDEPVVTQEVIEDPTQVIVDMVVKKDDSFDLFYVEDASEAFGPNRVRVDVKGKPESQKIIFNLPGEATLANLRLDVGSNIDQEEMTINNLTIKKKDKELVITPDDFFKKFSTTECIKLTPGKFSFKAVKSNEGYDPLFYGNYSLIDALGQFNMTLK